MKNNLVNFLSGNLAIQCQNATDMKRFVDWLKKHDIEDILVSNFKYRDDYFKISFWKQIVKESWFKNKWIHPYLLQVIFVYRGDRVDYYPNDKELGEWFGNVQIIRGETL